MEFFIDVKKGPVHRRVVV